MHRGAGRTRRQRGTPEPAYTGVLPDQHTQEYPRTSIHRCTPGPAYTWATPRTSIHRGTPGPAFTGVPRTRIDRGTPEPAYTGVL